jgi:hypothetical protein
MYIKQQQVITNFMLSWSFIANVNSALGYLHHLDVGSVANISDIYAASIFRRSIWQLSSAHFPYSPRPGTNNADFNPFHIT